MTRDDDENRGYKSTFLRYVQLPVVHEFARHLDHIFLPQRKVRRGRGGGRGGLGRRHGLGGGGGGRHSEQFRPAMEEFGQMRISLVVRRVCRLPIPFPPRQMTTLLLLLSSFLGCVSALSGGTNPRRKRTILLEA